MLNIGIDFKVLGDRLSGTIEYYQKHASDLLATVPIDYTAGLGPTTLIKNVGSMKGNGLDLTLNSLNLNGPVKWTTSLNLNTNSDKIEDYYFTSNAANVVASSGIAGLKGKPVVGVYSYPWAGLDPATGDPQGYINGHTSKDYATLAGPSLSLDDIQYNGPANPKIFGSLGNTLSWKGFTISAWITYKFGYYFKRRSINYSSLIRSGDGHLDFVKRWQKPGDEKITNVPSFVYPAMSGRDEFYSNSAILVDKGDHVRLQYINISYDFGKSQFRKLPIDHLQLYANINNIGILWRSNKDDIDPEIAGDAVPAPKSTAIGLRLTF